MSSTPIITVLGSSSAYQPIQDLAEAGKVQTHQHGVYARTSSTKEHLQIIAYLQGNLELPDDLLPYLCEPAVDELLPRDAAAKDALAGVDALVVELSSLKELRFRNWFLNASAVRTRTVDSHPDLTGWWERLNQRNPPVEDATEPAWNGAADIDQDVIRELRVVRQDAATVKRDMEAIHRAFGGPILWLTGSPAAAESEDADQEREWLVSWAQRGAARLGQPVSDVAQGQDIWSALSPLVAVAA